MKSLIIGTRGFLSTALLRKQHKNNLFVNPDHLDSLSKGTIASIDKVILISFDPNMKTSHGNDCILEKKILKIFDSEKILIQYFSTSKVYPNLLDVNEETSLNPSSIYAENKIIAEEFIVKNFKNFHIFRASNIFNNFGGAPKTFLHNVLNNLNKGKIQFDVSIDSYRDFISTDFIFDILLYNEFVKSGIYNLSSGIPIKIKEILNIIILNNNINRSSLYESFDSDIINQVLNNRKLIEQFNCRSYKKIEILQELGSINAK